MDGWFGGLLNVSFQISNKIYFCMPKKQSFHCINLAIKSHVNKQVNGNSFNSFTPV